MCITTSSLHGSGLSSGFFFFLCLRHDPRGGISWLSTPILLPTWTRRLVLCQTCKLDTIVFRSEMTSYRGWRAPCVRKQLCPNSSLGVTFIVLLGRKSNLKLLDSQELCLRCMCQPPQKWSFRAAGLPAYARKVCEWVYGNAREGKVFQGVNWGLEWSLIWGRTTYYASHYS